VVKAVIFDMDGTLLDSVDLQAGIWQETFRQFGREVPFEDVRRKIGTGDRIMQRFFSTQEVARFGDEMRRKRDELYRRDFLKHARPFPHVRELFQCLKADGKRILLASSASREDFEADLRMLHVTELVDGWSAEGADNPFRSALHVLPAISASEAAAVADAPGDVAAAVDACLATVGLLCGGFPEDDLRDAGCVEIYRDPEELMHRYESSPLL
jgi:beta-phosphoglucomutase-like phosphatase (HAD superfamily)